MIKIRIPKALPKSNGVVIEIEALNRAWQVERASEPGFYVIMAPRRLELTPAIFGSRLEWGPDLLGLIRVEGFVEEFTSGRLVLNATEPEGGEATYFDIRKPDHRPDAVKSGLFPDLAQGFSRDPRDRR